MRPTSCRPHDHSPAGDGVEAAMTMIRLLLILSCLLGAGCISIGTADVANDATMAQIHVGETTRQQLLALLGKPDNQLKTDIAGTSRDWWSYRYATAVISPIDYLLLYGFWFNGIGTFDTEYDLSISFDSQGVVSSLSRVKTDYNMGRPFSSLQVSSVSQKTLGSAESGKKPIHFEDTMAFRD